MSEINSLKTTVNPANMEVAEKCRPIASDEVYNTRSTAPCSCPSNQTWQVMSPSPKANMLIRTKKIWRSIHHRYKTCHVIGQGTYGIVYKGERQSPSVEDVALKRMRLEGIADFGIPETALREVTILNDLKHENILRLDEISCTTNRIYMICEYLEMDLKRFMKAQERAVPLYVIKRITYEILKGLAFCHGHRVMHRDLKPHNILLDRDAKRVKIADFGLARPTHAPGKTLTHEVVTLWYRAPELLLGNSKYTGAIDMWSLGCIIAELFTGRALFPGDSEIDTLFRIFRFLGTPTKHEWPTGMLDPHDQFPVFKRKHKPFSQLSEDPLTQDLLGKLCCYDPENRMTAGQCLRHAWFDQIRTPVEDDSGFADYMDTDAELEKSPSPTLQAQFELKNNSTNMQRVVAPSPVTALTEAVMAQYYKAVSDPGNENDQCPKMGDQQNKPWWRRQKNNAGTVKSRDTLAPALQAAHDNDARYAARDNNPAVISNLSRTTKTNEKQEAADKLAALKVSQNVNDENVKRRHAVFQSQINDNPDSNYQYYVE